MPYARRGWAGRRDSTPPLFRSEAPDQLQRLALEEAGGDYRLPPVDLLTLAAPEMERVGRFTCGACKMYCTIDRFEVAGRRFPFGGRCSLYENVWKRKARIVAAMSVSPKRPITSK